ncbi:recombinase family protein [Pseudomonas nitroreducens]|uniref:Recombinase family protein n=2 Tax=Pseudomonas nitroreducens TaxID=46680 RepID=A0A6G6INT5_PSENT|nr:recombinase family protein [Pseudomonas nitroreducens]
MPVAPTLSPAELEARLRLHALPELGPRRFHRLLEAFGSASAALSAPAAAWRSLGLPAACAEPRRDASIREQAAEVLHWLEAAEHHLVMWDAPGYPALLAELGDAPPLLFLAGEPNLLERPQLAMVGSRRASKPGLDTARAFARSLAGGGFVITSGLALGIDGAAHEGALEAGGKTVAVLGTGLERLYPRRHLGLAKRIVEQGGAVISELPLNSAPQASNFPRRNRIMIRWYDYPREFLRINAVAKAYAYVRYSRITQESGDSEARQYNALERFTASTGVEIQEVIYDRGKSAFRGDNARSGYFKEILERINNRKIKKDDFLVVESIDRITRQRVIDGVELLQGILKKGIKIYTTTDEKIYSYSDPARDFETLMMIALIAQRANEESETKSKRLNSAWRKRREKAQNGEIIIKSGKAVPYGLRVENGQFVIVEEEQKEIEQLFNFILEYGINTSIVKINKISKKKWNNGTLNKILKAKTVIGCMPMHRIEYDEKGKSKKILTGYIENYYPKIIEPALFYKAVDTMKNRKAKNWTGNRTEQDFNIFKHQIYCAECGSKMYYDHRGSRYKDKIYPFFKCDNARVQKHICTAENVRFEYVLGSLLDSLKSIKKIGNSTSWQKTGFGKRANKFNGSISSVLKIEKDIDNDVSVKIKELNECRLKIENLNAKIEELDFNVPKIFVKKLSELEHQYDEMKKEIEILESQSTEQIDIQDELTVIELFKTESGRLKLNRFFKENSIIFNVSHEKKSRTTRFEIKRKNDVTDERLSLNLKTFQQKNILHEFDLVDLQTMFDLSVKD